MPRIRFALLLATAAALLSVSAALVACGGGGSGKKTPTTGPAATSSSGGSTASAGGATAAATTESTKSSGGSSGTNDDLKGFAEKFSNSTFSADYKIAGVLGTDVSDGSMKLIKKGKDKFRFEINGTQAGQDFAVIFIDTPDVSAYCLKNSAELGAALGVPEGEGVCFKSPDDGTNPVGSISDALTDFENQDVTVLEKSSRRIAGRDGTCFKVRDNKTTEVSLACFDDDGAMLFVESEGDTQAGTIEATAVDKSVSDSDFEPPYELRDAPDFLGGDGTTP